MTANAPNPAVGPPGATATTCRPALARGVCLVARERVALRGPERVLAEVRGFVEFGQQRGSGSPHCRRCSGVGSGFRIRSAGTARCEGNDQPRDETKGRHVEAPGTRRDTGHATPPVRRRQAPGGFRPRPPGGSRHGCRLCRCGRRFAAASPPGRDQVVEGTHPRPQDEHRQAHGDEYQVVLRADLHVVRPRLLRDPEYVERVRPDTRAMALACSPMRTTAATRASNRPRGANGRSTPPSLTIFWVETLISGIRAASACNLMYPWTVKMPASPNRKMREARSGWGLSRQVRMGRPPSDYDPVPVAARGPGRENSPARGCAGSCESLGERTEDQDAADYRARDGATQGAARSPGRDADGSAGRPSQALGAQLAGVFGLQVDTARRSAEIHSSRYWLSSDWRSRLGATELRFTREAAAEVVFGPVAALESDRASRPA